MTGNKTRNGIIAAGNWCADLVKFIEKYPSKGNLTKITKVSIGLGGLAHNVIIDLAHLKSGIPLYAGGCIGNDEYGRMCLEDCERNGVDTSNMFILDDVPTSYTDVMTETCGGGARTFFYNAGTNARFNMEHVLSMDTDARIFHLGYLLLLDEMDKEDPEYGVVAARVLDQLQKKGYKTSVDVVSEEGNRYRKVIFPCLKYMDYFIINEVELGNCLGRAMRDTDGNILEDEVIKGARELLDAGVSELVVIHYPEGGVAVASDGRVVCAPSFSPAKEEIISTVGAGDAFCAGALYAIHEGYELEDMLKFAAASARFNLFCTTTTDGAPDLETIKNFIKNR